MSRPSTAPELKMLRERFDVRASAARPALPFGCEALDRRIAAGGLALDALHEIAPASAKLEDDGAATLFLAGLAGRCVSRRGGVLWVVTRFDLYSPGVQQVGLDPRDVLYAQASDDTQALALIEDGLRHGGLSAVVGEVARMGMAESRRLQLAAADAGLPVMLLRRRRRTGSCPIEQPSAALTRWRIGVHPAAHPSAVELGRHRWSVELVRQRGGEGFVTVLEGCDDQGRLAVPPPTFHRAASPRDQAASAA